MILLPIYLFIFYKNTVPYFNFGYEYPEDFNYWLETKRIEVAKRILVGGPGGDGGDGGKGGSGSSASAACKGGRGAGKGGNGGAGGKGGNGGSISINIIGKEHDDSGKLLETIAELSGGQPGSGGAAGRKGKGGSHRKSLCGKMPKGDSGNDGKIGNIGKKGEDGSIEISHHETQTGGKRI